MNAFSAIEMDIAHLLNDLRCCMCRADSPSTRSAIERTTNELLDIVYRKKNNPLPQSLTGKKER